MRVVFVFVLFLFYFITIIVLDIRERRKEKKMKRINCFSSMRVVVRKRSFIAEILII